MKIELKQYRVFYTDEFDEGCPQFAVVVRASSVDGAYQRFHDLSPDSCETDGWAIDKIEVVS